MDMRMIGSVKWLLMALALMGASGALAAAVTLVECPIPRAEFSSASTK